VQHTEANKQRTHKTHQSNKMSLSYRDIVSLNITTEHCRHTRLLSGTMFEIVTISTALFIRGSELSETRSVFQYRRSGTLFPPPVVHLEPWIHSESTEKPLRFNLLSTIHIGCPAPLIN